jgi:hypothetical protein
MPDLASSGKLKLVLRLELLDRPRDAARPELETEVRREERPDASAPVGEVDSVGELGALYRPPMSKVGMSTEKECAELAAHSR